MAAAEASTTTVRTVISGPSMTPGTNGNIDEAASVLNGFEGVPLDAEAQAAIAAALEACAERARAAQAAYDTSGEVAADAAEDDPGQWFVQVGEQGDPYRGELIPPVEIEEFVPFADGEPPWHLAGAEMPEALAQWEEEREALKAREG